MNVTSSSGRSPTAAASDAAADGAAGTASLVASFVGMYMPRVRFGCRK